MLVATGLGGIATWLVVVASSGGGLDFLLPFTVFLGLMGVAFVAFGVGISAASASDGRATALAVGVYLVFVALWNLIQGGHQVGAAAVGLIEAGTRPAWLAVINTLPPNQAAVDASETFVHGGGLFTADPLASVWLPVVILLVWLVVPLGFGYLRFRGVDIG